MILRSFPPKEVAPAPAILVIAMTVGADSFAGFFVLFPRQIDRITIEHGFREPFGGIVGHDASRGLGQIQIHAPMVGLQPILTAP